MGATNRVCGSRIGQQIAAPPQNILEQSSVKMCKIGQRIWTDDGRSFRYCYNGGVALTANKLVVPATAVGQVNLAVAISAAIGDKKVNITSGAVVVADQYQNGLFTDYNDGDGSLLIAGNDAETTGSGDVWFRLNDGLYTALVAGTDTVSVSQNPCWGTLISVTDQADCPIGVPLIDVTLNYYYWAQCAGACHVLCDNTTLAQGDTCGISAATAGAVGAVDADAEPVVGIMLEAGVSTKYSLVQLILG